MEFLRSLDIFEGLDDDVIGCLSKGFQKRSFAADEIIFHQGTPGSSCHIITKGRVRIFVIGEEGRELSVRILQPGEIFGEMALFEDLPRSASVQALEPTNTLVLHRDVLFQCLERSPGLALRLLQSLSARLRRVTSEAEELASLTVAERLIRRLQQMASWCGTRTEDGVRIDLPMTQQELASLVGTRRESVNRAMMQLRREGEIRVKDGWIILLDDSV